LIEIKLRKNTFLLLFLFYSQVSFAETEGARKKEIHDLYALTLEELLSLKVEVANRTPTELIKAPSSVTIFTAEQIKLMGLKTLEQLLAYVPGIHVARGEEGGGTYSVSVRGKHSDPAASRDILILLDGMRLNDPMTSGAMEQERQVSLFNVKRVEVIRGPGSALYGANAFLGVINIVTDKKQNVMSTTLGSFNSYEGALQLSDSKKNWSWSLAAQYYEDKGEYYSGFYEFWGQIESTQDPARRIDLDFQFELNSFSAKLRRSEHEYEDFIAGGGQLNNLQKQLKINESLQLKYQQSFKQQELSFYLESQQGLSDYLLGLFPYNPQPAIDPASGLYWSDGAVDAMVGGNIRTIKQRRMGVDAHWKINSENQLAYGLVFRKEETSLNPFQGNYDLDVLQSSGELVPSQPDNFIQQGFYIGGTRFDLLNPESRDVRGAYVQNETQLGSAWKLTIGLRNDNYEGFGGHTSIRSGLVYNNDSSFWKLLYGEAFRAPSIIETRAGIASGGIANPDLLPEVVKTTELVWGTHNDEWNTSVSLYHNQFSDIIVPVLVDDVMPGFTAFQPQNLGEKSNSGLEFEMRFQLSNQWQLYLGGDFQINEIKSQNMANKHFFINLDYRSDDLKMNYKTRYMGEVVSREVNLLNSQALVVLDDYWISDINLRWTFLPEYNFTVNINNIFNQTNQSFNSQNGLERGLPGHGRKINVGIEYLIQ